MTCECFRPQVRGSCGTSQDVSKKLLPGLRPITIEYADLTGKASFPPRERSKAPRFRSCETSCSSVSSWLRPPW